MTSLAAEVAELGRGCCTRHEAQDQTQPQPQQQREMMRIINSYEASIGGSSEGKVRQGATSAFWVGHVAIAVYYSRFHSMRHHSRLREVSRAINDSK